MTTLGDTAKQQALDYYYNSTFPSGHAFYRLGLDAIQYRMRKQEQDLRSQESDPQAQRECELVRAALATTRQRHAQLEEEVWVRYSPRDVVAERIATHERETLRWMTESTRCKEMADDCTKRARQLRGVVPQIEWTRHQ